MTFFYTKYVVKTTGGFRCSVRSISVCILCTLVLRMKVDVNDGGGLGRLVGDLQPGVLLMPVTAVTKALLFSTLTDLLLDR